MSQDQKRYYHQNYQSQNDDVLNNNNNSPLNTRNDNGNTNRGGVAQNQGLYSESVGQAQDEDIRPMLKTGKDDFTNFVNHSSELLNNTNEKGNKQYDLNDITEQFLDTKTDKQKKEINKQKTMEGKLLQFNDETDAEEEESSPLKQDKSLNRLKEEKKRVLNFDKDEKEVFQEKDEKETVRLRYQKKDFDKGDYEKNIGAGRLKFESDAKKGYSGYKIDKDLKKEIRKIGKHQEEKLNFETQNAYRAENIVTRVEVLATNSNRRQKLIFSNSFMMEELDCECTEQQKEGRENRPDKLQHERSNRLRNGSKYQKRNDNKHIEKDYQKKKNQQKSMENVQANRDNNDFISKAKETARKIIATIRNGIIAIIGVIMFLFVILLIIIFIMIYLVNMGKNGAGALFGGLYQATYSDISDCEAYFRELETDLEDKIAHIEDEYPDCYEYIYILGNIGHKAIDLVSYLSVKYPDLTLEKSVNELNALFEEMYTLTVEIKEELREREKRDTFGNIIYDENGKPETESFIARICYITLEVKPWEEIVDGHLTAEEKSRYNVYLLSEGAQQVYGNPLLEDWQDKISSQFGYRIHPITKIKTFHEGIDIAVPVGTPLFSCTNGVVTIAQYSETAGNYIVVLMESGYSVKYMHLDNLGVFAGDTVSKGMLIGETGNTGRSTGPHLHLEVRTPDNKPIDPTFIVINGISIEGE